MKTGDSANVTPLGRNTVLDTKAATRAKVERMPYSVQKAGREALKLWIEPLAKRLAESRPPRGFEQVLRAGLNYDQLVFMALRATLDQIHFGWDKRKGRKDKAGKRRRRKVRNPNMLFWLELGQAVRDELEFVGLLSEDAKKYMKAARNKRVAIGKFRRVDWTPPECAQVDEWLWRALMMQMNCFDVDERGYPKVHDDHKATMDRLAAEALYDHPLYKPKLFEPPPWTAWRVECPGDIGAAFVKANDPVTIETFKAAFKDGSIDPHARAVSAIQSVPFKINPTLLPLVQEFAGEDYGRDVHIAEALVGEPRFWNRVRCDRRGRLIQVCDFNYTRSDPVRSLFMFAEGAKIGDSIKWLEVEVANAYGAKGTWTDRHDWVAKHRELVKAVAADPARIWRRGVAAEEPFRFAAACIEYVAADTHGPAYLTHLPCWLDASANGLQLLSIMVRDVKLAELVNLKVRATEDEPIIHDPYLILAHHVRQGLSADELSQVWRDANLRALLKQPVMTLFYGVTPWGMLDQIRGACDELKIDAPFEAMERLRDHIWKAIGEKLPGAVVAREYIQSIAQYCLDHGTYMRWVTLSGFPVENRYCKSKTQRVRMPLSGQSVTIANGYTDAPKKRDVINGAVANFVHSWDATILTLSVNLAFTNGITNFMTVHDCFGARAPDVQLFGKIRRWRLPVMAVHDPLEKLRAANLPEGTNDLPLPDYDADFDIVRLAESEYFDR
jgi:hypothetical protein